jgi:hypothetical protein
VWCWGSRPKVGTVSPDLAPLPLPPPRSPSGDPGRLPPALVPYSTTAGRCRARSLRNPSREVVEAGDGLVFAEVQGENGAGGGGGPGRRHRTSSLGVRGSG